MCKSSRHCEGASVKFSSVQVVFQEVPNEISLAFQIVGCPLRCPGCHSSDLWNSNSGKQLNTESLAVEISKYRSYISCILYLGGEWEAKELAMQLEQAIAHGLKTALYTGLDLAQVDDEILKRLDYIKYGPFDAALGPLSSATTNQRIINLKTNENLNRYFIHGGSYDSIRP